MSRNPMTNSVINVAKEVDDEFVIKSYIRDAERGHNPYKIDLDQEWIDFLNKGFGPWIIFKMLITTIPALSVLSQVFSFEFIIDSCAQVKPYAEPIPISKCFQFNNYSSIITNKEIWKAYSSIVNPFVFFFFIFFFIYFFFIILMIWSYLMARRNMWLRGGNITFTSDSKVLFMCLKWIVIIANVCLVLILTSFAADIGSPEGLTFQKIGENVTIQFSFVIDDMKFNLKCFSILTSSFSLIIALYKVLNDDAWIFNFKEYRKTSALVSSKAHDINLRITQDSVPLVTQFYLESNKKNSYYALVALNTYLLDNGEFIEETTE